MPPKRKANDTSDDASKRQKQSENAPIDNLNPHKWWKGDVGPHAPGLYDDPCPINWTVVGDVDPMLQEVYILRSPWKESPDYSFVQLQKTMNSKYGTNHNTETWRKRFMKVNKMVFNATGIWYERFSIGLEPLLGKAPKAARVKGNARKTLREPTMKYHGDTFILYIQEPGMMEGDWKEQREVPIDAAFAASPHFRAAVNANRSSITVEATPRLIDLLFSIYIPRRRSDIPQDGYRLRRNDNNECVFDTVCLNFTTDDIFDLYVLASAWESFDTCDLIIDHWRRIYHEEETLRMEYLTGARHFSDVPKDSLTSILDFEPRHINLLWNADQVDGHDAAHDVWLDILKSKGNVGFDVIMDDFTDYDIKFLLDWHERLTHSQQTKVDPLFKKYHPNIVLSDFEETTHETFQHRAGVILGGNATETCSLYHNHEHARQPCYLQFTTPATSAAKEDKNGSDWPDHRVVMSINGIPGFIIYNHTGYSKDEFQTLPKVFPEWDWERIRAVNCHERVETSEYVPRNKNHYILPQPVYFNGPPGLQDEKGRFPSHPGYGDPGWAPVTRGFGRIYEDDEDDEDYTSVVEHQIEDYSSDEDGDIPQINADGRKTNGRWREFLVDRLVDKRDKPLPPCSKGGFGFEPYGSFPKFWY